MTARLHRSASYTVAGCRQLHSGFHSFHGSFTIGHRGEVDIDEPAVLLLHPAQVDVLHDVARLRVDHDRPARAVELHVAMTFMASSGSDAVRAWRPSGRSGACRHRPRPMPCRACDPCRTCRRGPAHSFLFSGFSIALGIVRGADDADRRLADLRQVDLLRLVRRQELDAGRLQARLPRC